VVNHKRVERIWRREGLRVPQKQPKRGRLWLNDGSCVRLRACWRNHVWSYEFVSERTHDVRPLRLLVIVDEYTRECLAIVAERRLQSVHVLELLGELFVERGVPGYIRSDNGSEFTARLVRERLHRTGVETLYIPMRSRLAAISLGCKQPETRPRVGTKNPVRSNGLGTNMKRGTKFGGRSDRLDRKSKSRLFGRSLYRPHAVEVACD
jgi:transposase InsO family protein